MFIKISASSTHALCMAAHDVPDDISYELYLDKTQGFTMFEAVFEDGSTARSTYLDAELAKGWEKRDFFTSPIPLLGHPNSQATGHLLTDKEIQPL